MSIQTKKCLNQKPKASSKMNEEHVPVLLEEVVEGLNIKPDGTYLDLTIGRAGHALKIVERLSSKGRLIGLDQDKEAIQKSDERLKKVTSNYLLIHSNFREIKKVLKDIGVNKVDGVIMDLGVSSPQFDNTERGFSYRSDYTLDMRMDLRKSLTAKEVVNTYSAKRLTEIFREYGEDRYAYQVAKRIIERRKEKEIVSTLELVEIIKSAKPMKELAKKGHPAKQIFQALRIEVNDEVGALKEGLKDIVKFMSKGARLVVISFHSLEDKIVKDFFKSLAVTEGSRKNIYSLPQEDETEFRLITKKAIVPSLEEKERNPRSKSAKMRILERKEDQDA